jgi:hypothetical protein
MTGLLLQLCWTPSSAAAPLHFLFVGPTTKKGCYNVQLQQEFFPVLSHGVPLLVQHWPCVKNKCIFPLSEE